jgi:hypothetical protein
VKKNRKKLRRTEKTLEKIARSCDERKKRLKKSQEAATKEKRVKNHKTCDEWKKREKHKL